MPLDVHIYFQYDKWTLFKIPDRFILNVKTGEFYCTQDLHEESLASFKLF